MEFPLLLQCAKANISQTLRLEAHRKKLQKEHTYLYKYVLHPHVE
jgi:hypothetical protein